MFVTAVEFQEIWIEKSRSPLELLGGKPQHASPLVQA